MPLGEDVDFQFLAKQFPIAGGDIRNVALEAAFLAAQDGKVVTMKQLAKALARQMMKQGKVPSATDFKQYHALIEKRNERRTGDGGEDKIPRNGAPKTPEPSSHSRTPAPSMLPRGFYLAAIHGTAGNMAVQRVACEVSGENEPVRSESAWNFLSEQEAEQVENVTRQPGDVLPPPPAGQVTWQSGASLALRVPLSLADVPPVVSEVLRTPGEPLDVPARAFMEQRFGHDFGHVRVHTDEDATESARAVGAHAYTVGAHIVFGRQQYAPATTTGRRLLAHELTHVVQQGRGDGRGVAPYTLQRQPVDRPSLPSSDAPDDARLDLGASRLTERSTGTGGIGSAWTGYARCATTTHAPAQGLRQPHNCRSAPGVQGRPRPAHPGHKHRSRRHSRAAHAADAACHRASRGLRRGAARVCGAWVQPGRARGRTGGDAHAQRRRGNLPGGDL